jgi:hypothetical protein
VKQVKKILAMFALLLPVLLTSKAHAWFEADGAFAWVVKDGTTGAWIVPSMGAYNSGGGVITAKRLSGTGQVRVSFPNLTTIGGNVQVSANPRVWSVNGQGLAEADDTGYCNIIGWGHDSLGLNVDVACFDRAGLASEVGFNVSYSRSVENFQDSPVKAHAYLWNNSSAAPLQQEVGLNTSWVFTSARSQMTVRRTDTGAYTLRLPGQGGGPTGNVMVTAYGGTPTYCNVQSLYTSGVSDLVIDVRCFQSPGTPVNSLFTLSYGRFKTINQQLAGFSVFSACRAAASSVIKTFPSTTAAQQMPGLGAPNFPGDVTLKHLALGRYVVLFPAANFIPQTIGGVIPGMPIVQSFAAGANRCSVASWAQSTGAELDITCFNPSGGYVDVPGCNVTLASGPENAPVKKVPRPSSF